MRRFVVALGLLSVIGCSGDPPPTGPADATASDAIDCSKVGCAPPPPCGQACKQPCGCCANTTCRDASVDS